MVTHRVWVELVGVLTTVHGRREGKPEQVQELVESVEKVEELYRSLTLKEAVELDCEENSRNRS